MNFLADARVQHGKISVTMMVGLALALAYALTWVLFTSEGNPRTVQRGDAEKGVPIIGHVIAVDLVKDTISLMLVPDAAAPSLAAGRKLTADVELEIDSGISLLAHKFKNGESPIPWVVNIPIQDGDLTEFPVDNYLGQFSVKVGLNGGTKSVANLNIEKVVHGFKFSSLSESSSDHTEVEVDFRLSRSPAVVFLAVMAMLSLTVVVCSALNVAWQVANRGRKLEFGMMVWVAALLFVIPAVRNGMPGSPPPGAMVDVGLFFWLHVLTVISLLMLVATWSKDGKKA